MKEYYRENRDAFSADGISGEEQVRFCVEEKKILWTVSVISWGCFLTGIVLRFVRIYEAGSI